MRLPEKPWSKEELEEFLNLPMAHSKSGGDTLTQALLDERAEGR